MASVITKTLFSNLIFLQKPKMALSLDSLSTEVLIRIFKCLDIHDLCNLKQTCKRFNDVINAWDHLLVKNVRPVVTNQVHPVVLNRSTKKLSQLERLRISRNWRLGIYDEKLLLYSKIKYFPSLHLEKDLLWISREGNIHGYQRTHNGINTKRPIHAVKVKNNRDIFCFVKRNNFILSGQTDGSLSLWSLEDKQIIFELGPAPGADVNAVDMLDDILVSGSRDDYVKIWRKPYDSGDNFEQINLQDQVWSVALSGEDKSLLAIGTAGAFLSNATVTIFDMMNHKNVTKLSPEKLGAGVLDIEWEGPSILWTCGYDSYLRRWDLRSGKCEQAFSDPCGATVYCFQYDHFNTIISGADSMGRAVLWDTRKENHVQMYFMNACRRGKSSPIYGLSFDAEYLFTVTDQHLNVLNFSVYGGSMKDYSHF